LKEKNGCALALSLYHDVYASRQLVKKRKLEVEKSTSSQAPSKKMDAVEFKTLSVVIKLDGHKAIKIIWFST
jgi:hypothetical protein